MKISMCGLQVSGSNVHNVLKILNSRLGSEGNIKDTKDVAYVTVYVAVSYFIGNQQNFKVFC
jgi:hypothetical protein